MTSRAQWSDIDREQLVAVELPDDQRDLVVHALIEWGGPTRPTDAIARAMGFDSQEAIHREGERIRSALIKGEPMTKRDWARALVATEIVFASSYYGAAGDWEEMTGWDHHKTLDVLRALQHSLSGLRAPSRSGRDQQDALASRDTF